MRRVQRALRFLTGSLVIACSIPALAQTRPPLVTDVTPWGLQRGTTVTVTVDGANIGDADRVLFDHPGLSARIVRRYDLGPDIPTRRPDDTNPPIDDVATRSLLAVEVTAAPDMPSGTYGFRLLTPLGTSTFMPIAVGRLVEARELEPNDRPEQADSITAPVTVQGAIFTAGDVDQYRLHVTAGEPLVLRADAVAIGSRLDAVLTLLDESGAVLATSDDFGDTRDPLIVHTPASDGTRLVRITDALSAGSPRHVYRLTAGRVPFLTRAFPIGVPRESAAAVQVDGINLESERLARVGAEDPERPDRAPLVLPGLEPLNRVEVALGRYPEIVEDEMDARGRARSSPVSLPVTINGRLHRPGGGADEDVFAFRAEKGEQVVISVSASRLGSPLDSVLEIVDAEGRPIPRAVLRPVWETTMDLRSRDSLDRGLRLLTWSELRRGDWVYIDRELMRVAELPKGPDEDVTFESFRGRRLAFLDTTNEGHALGRPVYKVEVHPPDATFSPNGLPLFTLFYRNDDGGPMWGKDSRVVFTAPQSATYSVRLSDARGESGEDYAYRLTLAPPRPDFDLFVSPSNPNVPRGGRVPVTVAAYRHDGFDGPIAVELRGLPDGLVATTGTILPGESTVALTVEASPAAGRLHAPLQVAGTARIDGRAVTHVARADQKVSVLAVAAPPEVRVVSVEPSTIEIVPGGSARVRAVIRRENGFKGRVPVGVLNLPFRVTVPDIGLNGILITESQDSREFEIVADGNAPAVEQTIFVTARVETNGVASPEQVSAPITIRVAPPAPGGE